MKLTMKFYEFCNLVKDYMNEPLSLEVLTMPFGILSSDQLSDDLLVGYVVDGMQEEFRADDVIDVLDVMRVAYDLGDENAGDFLDEAPTLLTRLARESLSQQKKKMTALN